MATAVDAQEITRDAPWPVLIDFWSPQTGDPRAAVVELEKVAKRHQGRLIVLRLNVEQVPDALAAYGVQALPTYVLFTQGREVRRMTGTQSADQLEFALRAA